MAQVSVVIVCMGDPTVHLYACLDSLFAQNRTPLEVWVVAYLMQAEHREALAARYPAIHIIESREVRGFAENNNLALRKIDSEYCFVVNPCSPRLFSGMAWCKPAAARPGPPGAMPSTICIW